MKLPLHPRENKKSDKTLNRYKTLFGITLINGIVLSWYLYCQIPSPELLSPLPAYAFSQTTKTVSVDHTFTTQKQQILAYLVEKFGDRSADAIAMIDVCENSSFDPNRVSPMNHNGTYDVGVMQINTGSPEEMEKMKDWKANIDRGYEKYKAAGNKFTAWTCAHVIGEKNYLGK